MPLLILPSSINSSNHINYKLSLLERGKFNSNNVSYNHFIVNPCDLEYGNCFLVKVVLYFWFDITEIGMQNSFIVFIFKFWINLMHFLCVSTTGTVTYYHNQWWTALSKADILVTRFDDVTNILLQIETELNQGAYFEDNRPGYNDLIHFREVIRQFCLN